eukprot:3973494-Karenia_brevis.AAC.1
MNKSWSLQKFSKIDAASWRSAAVFAGMAASSAYIKMASVMPNKLHKRGCSDSSLALMSSMKALKK